MTVAERRTAFVPELLGRSDYAIIGEIVEPRSQVLDLGCGEGELLEWLAANKGVEARGVELSGAKVQRSELGPGIIPEIITRRDWRLIQARLPRRLLPTSPKRASRLLVPPW